MRTQLDEARRRLLQKVRSKGPLGPLLTDVAKELVAAGAARVLVWAGRPAALVTADGQSVSLHEACAEEDVPELARRAARELATQRELDAIAVPAVSDEQVAPCVLVVEGVAIGETELDVLGDIAAVLALGIEAVESRAALAAADRRLAVFVDHTPAPIAVFDRGMRYVAVSRRFAANYGLASGDILGRSHYEVFPEVSEHWRDVHRRCLGGAIEQSPPSGEAFPRADGRVDWVRWEIRPWHDDRGEIGGIVLFSHVVTEQHEIASALEASEARFRAIFEQAGVGIVEVDAATRRFRVVNEKACQILGYTREELLGRDFPSITHPDDRAEDFVVVQRVLSGEVPSASREKRYLRSTGEVAWARVTVTRLDVPGSAPGTVAMIEDIGERKRAEENLRLLESAINATANAVVITDTRARIQKVNPAFTRLTGYAEAEVLGRNPNILRSGLQDRAFYAELWRTILAGDVWRGELVNRRKDGSLYFEDMTITPIRDDRGALTSFIAVKQDITERKRAESELRESEERYRALVDNLEDIVFGIDATGKLTFVNPAVESFGYRVEEVLGRSAAELLHEDDRALFHGLWAAPEESPARELRFVDAQGKVRPVRMRLRPYRIGSRAAGASGVAVDLTARRETEEQLRASQKMEAVGRLAGGVAHDFNNLLSVILSYSELAVGELHEEDPLRADLQEVLEAVHRAEALTRQLLAFSRKQILAPEALDLNELVGKVSRMLERLIGEDIELVLAPSADVPRTRVDRGQMEQVLLNLAVNARDAMPEGGRLAIATRGVVLDAARAHALELPAGKYVELSVSDTGQGMPESVRSRVFEPFFTTKGPGKGTGLGLSMVFGIVRQSGGAVAVESTEGEGSSFRIYLPEHTGHVAPALARETRRRPERGHECVLVVEDEPALGAVVKRVLTSAGYEVLLASGALEAMSLAGQEGQRVRLILTDVIMPVMSGRELAARLVPLCPGARVVFMSGYTDEAIERFGVLDAEFLRKPFDLRILTERVRAVLDATSA